MILHIHVLRHVGRHFGVDTLAQTRAQTRWPFNSFALPFIYPPSPSHTCPSPPSHRHRKCTLSPPPHHSLTSGDIFEGEALAAAGGGGAGESAAAMPGLGAAATCGVGCGASSPWLSSLLEPSSSSSPPPCFCGGGGLLSSTGDSVALPANGRRLTGAGTARQACVSLAFRFRFWSLGLGSWV